MTNKRLIEQVEDILSKWELFYGQRAGRELWAEKPKEVQDKDIENFCKDLSVVRSATVDAVVLPCKIGDDVYIIPSKANFYLNILSRLEKNNRVYHQKVAEIVFTQDCWYARGNADKEYGTGRVLLDIFYKKTWFLTQEEAEAALAKMDGGNEDG